MSHSKYGIVSLAVFLSAASHAGADLPSFDSVRQRYQETGDLTSVSYLYRRCAALHLNVSALLLRKKQSKAAKDYENLADHYMLLSESTDKALDQKRGITSRNTMDAVSYSVKHMAQAYDAHMKANYAQRGDYIAGDAVLEAELAECLNPEAFSKRLSR